ncbi:hypothetical protein OD350_29100 (plasmid) [Clostridium beijerinckii]|uniref:hypothetical protein n=1 Tax=Clostridium beijerinckii TaxID=1520 RepID=UPI002226A347|nr:hypothetical protein [Clostridium beijerinckii]UYZ38947.1 hypothetical protein OD350_29100 [Clostridium beijerinckii]
MGKMFVAGALTVDGKVWTSISDKEEEVRSAISRWNRSEYLLWNSPSPLELKAEQSQIPFIEKEVIESIRKNDRLLKEDIILK